MKRVKELCKAFVFSVMAVPMLTSCVDNDGSGNAGFSHVIGSDVFANTHSSEYMFYSMGNWNMNIISGNEFAELRKTSGSGYVLNTVPVVFKENLTGSRRFVSFHVQDVAEKKAYMEFSVSQYATRGDGSFGNAPLATKIEGSDGSVVNMGYDDYKRPTYVKITKDNNVLHDIVFRYPTDTTMTAHSEGSILRGRVNTGYQPSMLVSDNDTVGYESNGAGLGFAYNLEYHKKGGEIQRAAILLKEYPETPDSEIKFDSLKYQHRGTDGTFLEKLKIEMSVNSNRHQSVDANQLLFGVEHCNPYALVALFRSARCSNVFAVAKSANGNYTVETELNGDKSVKAMTVTDKQGKKITYTFTY
ncbi:hypothetical protein [Xylanibacter muris]|uniref:Lipoprotein n=1 Tax=Xylanibacter muris TaxID=2736290 RepID=A0ABX2AP08_9BACT|nr:hypothetical protein [Xylanibacter muris]NPD92943.1 hypothetical protein [Xylanibacter muris]